MFSGPGCGYSHFVMRRQRKQCGDDWEGEISGFHLRNSPFNGLDKNGRDASDSGKAETLLARFLVCFGMFLCMEIQNRSMCIGPEGAHVVDYVPDLLGLEGIRERGHW